MTTIELPDDLIQRLRAVYPALIDREAVQDMIEAIVDLHIDRAGLLGHTARPAR